jgi:signal transduction histidine kinase
MHSAENHKAESLLRNVLHDLRQPLGVLEVTAYLMNLKMNDGRSLDREQLLCLERQVGRASRIVQQAAEELQRLHTQEAGANSLEFTNSATSAVR